jgi:hypothetical protein
MQLRQWYGVIFGIVLNYFAVMKLIILLVEFSRTIRSASVYFVVDALFFLFVNGIGLSGYCGTGPLWT